MDSYSLDSATDHALLWSKLGNSGLTIVACWLDTSFGGKSLTALADARASEKIGGTWHIHSDSAIKLFAIDVRCHSTNLLDPVLGPLINPYFETSIGVGFAGHCFEALTVIAHIQRAMGALCQVDGSVVLPKSESLLTLIATIAERYLMNHAFGSARSFELLVFGWDGPDQPWIGKIVWKNKQRIMFKILHIPTNSSIVTIGDGATSSKIFDFFTRVRRKIAHKLGKVELAPSSEANALSKAILAIEASKRLEEGVGKLIESQFVSTVGGVRQKLQIIWYDDRARAVLTVDDQPQIMDGLPSASDEAVLIPMTLIEKMP